MHDQRVVETDRHLVAGHENVEMVPFARIVVGQFDWGVAIFLIVVKTAGAFVFGVGFAAGRVPDLHLGTAAQVNAAVPALVDFPVHQQFKIGVPFGSANVVKGFALIDQRAGNDLPVLSHESIGFGLRRAEFSRRHLRALRRVGDQSLPTCQTHSVE